MRILALDWGTVRIGAAISDEEGRIAFSLPQPLEPKTAFEEIKKIKKEKSLDKIILGYPKTLEGDESDSSRAVLAFKQDLENTIEVPVELIDERLSSVGAAKILKEQGISEKKQRGIKDNMVAQTLLQQYLDTSK